MTSTVAPVSGRIAIQSGVVPKSVVTRETAFSPKTTEMFCQMFDRVARDSATSSATPTMLFFRSAASAVSIATSVPLSIAIADGFPRLGLTHYQNLWDPSFEISDILAAISRAKDEVVGAKRYAELADDMLVAANTREQKEAAEKCQEVAKVYAFYETLKEERACLDFGDLVSTPVRLVEGDAEVRQHLRDRHGHILVDEFQDVNRASSATAQGPRGYRRKSVGCRGREAVHLPVSRGFVGQRGAVWKRRLSGWETRSIEGQLPLHRGDRGHIRRIRRPRHEGCYRRRRQAEGRTRGLSLPRPAWLSPS